MSILHRAIPAIKYYLQAQTKYTVHSPLIFDFVTNILDDDRRYYAFEELEKLRQQLLRNTSKIPIVDFGAGSRKGKAPERSVADLAKTILTTKTLGSILFKMVNHYRCRSLVELGTALGLGTLYMAKAAPRTAVVHSIEGNPFIADFAERQFVQQKAENIRLHKGTFEDQLPEVLDELQKVDLVFFDGHHQKKPTLQYFEQCLAHAHEDSIFIFDDINWSSGMQEAWDEIKKHPQVTYSIDLFRAGIIFFKKTNIEKQHFTLIQHRWKPWSAGFFSS